MEQMIEDRPKKNETLIYKVKQQSFKNKSPVVRSAKIGRNQACPCGSGKKFKKCCISKV